MQRYAGWAIFSTYVFYLLSVPFSQLLPLSTLFAWLVVAVMWTTLSQSSRRQAVFLLTLGLAALCFAGTHGVVPAWTQVVAVNLPLLAMFVAVSFLSLTCPTKEDSLLPKGSRAVLTTALGTHLLGAVINLSVLFVFGERLQRKGTLSRVQMIVLARSFCAAAWWSPFFIATGVALVYAPEMLWTKTIVPGVLMSCIAMGYSFFEVVSVKKEDFAGYPLRAESLKVPLFLAAIVIGVHHFQNDLNILLLICLVAPVGTLIFMRGRPRLPALADFVDRRIASVSSQFALFLAAGVFSTGLKSVFTVYPRLLSLESAHFTPLLFSAVLAAMIIIGILGVHPVVTIAIASPLLLPLQPDHSQLGFLFLTGWAVSTASSPLSGVGLALTGRFGADPRTIIRDNWLYGLLMWAAASCMNILFFGDFIF